MGPTDLGRFSEPGVQVLIAVAAEPKHGYAIADEIEARAGRRPQPATLYGTLSRLEERGLITRLKATGRRTPFVITSAGEAELRARLDTIDRLLRDGRRVLRLRLA